MKRLLGSIFFVFVILMSLLSGCTPTSTSDSSSLTPTLLDVNEQVEDTQPKTVTISSDGSGDFATIKEAIEGIPPDSIVLLDEGQFNLDEPLLIQKSLTIQGAGASLTTISKSSSGSPVISFEGEQLIIKDLSIERTGEFASDIMEISAVEAHLENCNISGGAASEDDSIKGVGLWLTGDSNVAINNCVVKDNMGAGIVVNDHAKVTISQVTSSSNEIGLGLVENSVGDIQNSVFSDNQEFGILVYGLAQANIVGNSVMNNGSIGIQFQMDAANGEVRKNNLAKNDLRRSGTDIMIWEEYAPALIDNTCDGRGRSILGGDHNGIVFIGRDSIPENPTLEGNSCMIARCTTPDRTMFSLTCE
jgi:parallel beta-helix repeat protein